MQRAVVACRDPWMQEWLAAQLCRGAFAVQMAGDAAQFKQMVEATPPALVIGEPELLPVQMVDIVQWLVLGVEGGLPMPPTAADVVAELNKRGFATQPLRTAAFSLPQIEVDKTPPRRAPPPPLPDVLPLTANMRQVTWPRLLIELHLGGFSGQVKLTRNDQERRVLFQRGQVVAVHEAQGDTALYKFAQAGHWTPEQVGIINAYLGEHPGQVASAVFDAQLMGLGELSASLSAHYKELIAEAFTWTDAMYKIEAEPLVSTLGIEGALNFWPLLPLSVERGFKLNEIMDVMTPLAAQFIVPTPRFARASQNVLPCLPHLQNGKLLTGETRFQSALTSDQTQATALAQELYTLVACQFVKGSPTPQKVATPPPAAAPAGAPAPAPAPAAAAQSASPAQATGAVDYRTLSQVIAGITEAHGKVGKVDHFELLGIARDANASAIEAAFSARLKEMHLTQLPPGLADDVVKRAGAVLLALKQARFTLVDPMARQRYEAQLKRTPTN